ncbi:MAG: DUF3800 domain-containing protein [Dongiaceae bacterium]
MFIFLDESGDLGFDFTKPGTSTFFTITLLVCDNQKCFQAVKKAINRALKKINRKRRNKKICELKGTSTDLTIKSYFLSKMPKSGWKLYSITANKKQVYSHLQTKKGKKKLYNYLTKELLEFLDEHDRKAKSVNFIVDSCKDGADRKDFNAYIKANLENAFPLETAVHISHENSQENTGLQAVDLFCWGIQHKESGLNPEWYNKFSANIAKERRYFDKKKKEGARAA